jgi:hypothetical protein
LSLFLTFWKNFQLKMQNFAWILLLIFNPKLVKYHAFFTHFVFGMIILTDYLVLLHKYVATRLKN